MSDENPSDPPLWPLEPNLPPDLFAGAAEWYARFRVPYPRSLLDHLLARIDHAGGGRLLDLGCGTGELALPLADRFDEVLAVDLEPSMLEVGRRQAAELGITNVEWRHGRAEQLDAVGRFELITIGAAFHRFDRPKVARLAMQLLVPGRYLAIAGSNSVWTGKERWQKLAVEIIARWTDRPSTAVAPPAPVAAPLHYASHQDVLRAAGYTEIEEHHFDEPHEWTIPEFLGHLRSTSKQAAIQSVARDLIPELEAMLREHEPLTEVMDFYYILARSPAAAEAITNGGQR